MAGSLTSLTVALDARLIGGSSTGDSTYWTCLSRAMAEASPETHFLLLSNAEPPSEIPDFPNVRWITAPARSSRWWSYVTFPLLARRLGADVVHGQYSLSPLIRRGGVTTVHDVSFFVGPEWFRPRDRFILRRSVPASVRRAAAVITVSETSKREIEHFIPAAVGKSFAIHNACPPWIRRMSRDSAREIVKGRFDVEEPCILTVGTRWPRKNLRLAIEAFRIIREDIGCKLLVTGKEGWGDEAVVPGVVRTDYVSARDLGALYSAADLYVMPSLHEGFGITMLEAWRCGAPVICSSGGALPEVAGIAAFVEKSWEPADWAQTMVRLLSDEGTVSEMRRKGLEREATFTWERAAFQTLDVYRSVAG